jgi:hypothetical protein
VPDIQVQIGLRGSRHGASKKIDARLLFSGQPY